MLRFIFLLLATLIASHPAGAEEKLSVVTTFSVLGDMVSQVAGPYAEVTTLVGPDGDAHVFEPTPSDARKIAGAGLVFVNGLNFDPWMERLAKASGYRGPIIVASQGIEPRMMDEEEDGKGHGHGHDDHATVSDPHAWQDPSNGVIYVGNIVKALAAADPAHAEAYRAAGDRYIAEIRAVDAEARREIEKVPVDKRRVITSHDAFGYLGGAYGIRFLAPEGLSTNRKPPPATWRGCSTRFARKKFALYSWRTSRIRA